MEKVNLEGRLPDGTEVNITIEPKQKREFIYPVGPGNAIPARREYLIGREGYVLVPDEMIIK